MTNLTRKRIVAVIGAICIICAFIVLSNFTATHNVSAFDTTAAKEDFYQKDQDSTIAEFRKLVGCIALYGTGEATIDYLESEADDTVSYWNVEEYSGYEYMLGKTRLKEHGVFDYDENYNGTSRMIQIVLPRDAASAWEDIRICPECGREWTEF